MCMKKSKKFKFLFTTLVLSLIGCSSIQQKVGAQENKFSYAALENGGTPWRLVKVQAGSDGIVLNREGMKDDYTITFSDTGISGKAYPNKYFSGYEMRKGNNISFKPIAGTLMAPFNDPYLLKEQDYYKYLASTKSWNVNKGTLCLRGVLENGTEVLLFFTGN
ncbi:hypothetical protein FACS1894102_2780 [Spirochaetia bacterium]|nr:hypothetical protein FACS1894102_2780 [Spirochaetia bacterium]